MPNPPLPLPATTIQAAWGQAVTTRVVNVYQDAATRDAALPTPDDGQLAYLIDDDALTVRIAGVLWVTVGVGTFLQVAGDTMEGTLNMGGYSIAEANAVLGQDGEIFTISDGQTTRFYIKVGESVHLYGPAGAVGLTVSDDYVTAYHDLSMNGNRIENTMFMSDRPLLADANFTPTQGWQYDYINSTTANKPPTGQGGWTLLTTAFSATWGTQQAQDYRDDHLYVRSLEDGVWGTWHKATAT